MIIPGILEKDWAKIEEKLNIIKTFSKEAHIDFIDGKFAQNTTFFEASAFKPFSKEILLEAHLMVEDPLMLLDPLANAGFRRFIGHVEKMKNLEEFVAHGQTLGEVGLAIDLKTDIEKINIPFEDLDCILIMGVNAGFSGQEFNQETIHRIGKIRQRNETVLIEVDGGVNDKNIGSLKSVGANRFVVTSYLFGSQNPAKTYENLNNTLLD